jgi:hypothetical protein
MLPTESIVQYCSRACGLATELSRLGQPIAKPLLRLLAIHGLTYPFLDFSGQVATDVIYLVNGFNIWYALLRHLSDFSTHANILPATSSSPGCDIDPTDLAWISQPNLDCHQTTKIMACFKCPINRSNYLTLVRCGTLKRSANMTAKAGPPPTNGGGSNRAPGRSGGTQDSDD